ncbi:MAG TPA: undecaprenyl/decaprenyl-phosphate alpha-N-acetylglucosaminyl 1-phosphate transferase [Planctomycetaceae bacterium]|nr:undecaprenyl/decaprenyl-phosphate alpha-N-acetylglucosaminyl 1-phosphate transferase [Planctomycetaceae bacterium]
MLSLALVTLVSLALSLVLTPLVRSQAIKFGIVDHPDNQRKLHRRVVARAGGTAVLFSVLLTCSLAAFKLNLLQLRASAFFPYVALLTAMVAIWLLGLADDIWTLRGRQKLVGQILIASGLACCGFQIGSVQVLGYQLDLGLFAVPVSTIWLLATTNALNLIDGADGLCSTIGAVICGSLGVLAAVNNHYAEAAIAFAMCGALIGFLIFNFPPASIFLGDSGSLLIGMVTGALAIRCALKGPTTVAFLAPLAILSLPLLDSCMAIIRRKLTGRSIYTTDRAHLHHTLRNKGLGDRGLLAAVAFLSLTTASGALLGQFLGRDWIAPICVVVMFGFLVFTKAFGYAEVALVARRGSLFARSLMKPIGRPQTDSHHKTVRLQGNRQWDTVWMTLVEFAESQELSQLHMDLNVPWLEEGFHGTWRRGKLPDKTERWSTSLPICAAGRLAGRLDVVGPAILDEGFSPVAKLLELIEDLGPQIEVIMETPVEAPATQLQSTQTKTTGKALSAAAGN